MDQRYSGVLLHPTSLPSKYGIGSLGEEARNFIRWLSDSGQKIWQILPLGPTDWTYSPYQCYSAFAGNPDLIDLDLLVESGLIKKRDLSLKITFPQRSIDFKVIRNFREPLLDKAFETFKKKIGFDTEDYSKFWQENSWWLESWSLFYAGRKNIIAENWSYWDEELLNRNEQALNRLYHTYKSDVEYQRFLQFIFFNQWNSLKKFANNLGIKIFGDIPLYVSYDSVDVWANQDIFMLDKNRKPIVVGGVPPDYFSETGQLWGNPLFNWDNLRHREYDWWVARIHYNLRMFDLVRIDHFRGLESFWAVPYKEKTAANGYWMKAHGNALLRILQNQIGKLPIIAEDLGTITEEVQELRKRFYLPGMKVLQFAFADDNKNEHLPHNYQKDFVVYTGTHDNDTTTGWLKKISETERLHLKNYLGAATINNWEMIRLAFSSIAQIAIIPMQDVLGLSSYARMNTPGTKKGNWKWRLPLGVNLQVQGEKLRLLSEIYGR